MSTAAGRGPERDAREVREVRALGRLFAPPVLGDGVVVRCGRCGLVDPQRLGHELTDCVAALRAEVLRLSIPTQGGAPAPEAPTPAPAPAPEPVTTSARTHLGDQPGA